MHLGSIDASMGLNIGPWSSALESAIGKANQFKSTASATFGAVDKAASGVAKDLKSLDGTKVSIDAKGAISSLDAVKSGAGDVSKAVEAASGTALDVNTAPAIGSLQQLDGELGSVSAAVDAASGATLDIDAAPALASAAQVEKAVQDVSASVKASGGAVYGLDASDALSGLAEVKSAIADTQAAVKAAGGSSFDINASDALSSLDSLDKAVQDVSAQITAADGQTIAVSVTQDQIADALKTVQDLRATIGQGMTGNVSIGGLGDLQAAIDSAGQLRQAIGDVGEAAPNIDFSSTVSQLNAATQQAEMLRSTLSGLGSIGFGAGIAGVLLGPLVQGIKNAAQLEQSLKNVQVALGNVSKSDMSKLATDIKSIGTATQYSAKEIADVADSLAKAGYSVTDLVDHKMLAAVADLASATGEDLQVAVTGVVQAMAIWSPKIVDASIAMTDASRAADILTVAANASSADIQDIIAGMRNLGPVVATMGVSFNEAAAAVAVFTNYGMKGADAGVSLARGIQNLNDPTSDAAKEMQALGISVFDASGKFVGLKSLFGQLSNALRDVDDQTRLTAISTLFGAEAQDAYSLAVSMGVDPLTAIVDQMNQQGIAADQASEKTNTLIGAWDRLSEATNTALGGLAAGGIGPLTALASAIDFLVSSFGSLPSYILQPLGAITGFVGIALTAATTVNLLRGALVLMGTSFTRLTGIAALTGLIRNFSTTMIAARAAVTEFFVSIGPVGWAIIGVTAAVGVGLAIWGQHDAAMKKAAEAEKAYQDAAKATDDMIGQKRVDGMTKVADSMQHAMDQARIDMDQVSFLLKQQKQDVDDIFKENGDQLNKDVQTFLDSGIGQAATQWAAKNGGSWQAPFWNAVAQGGIDWAKDSSSLNSLQTAIDHYFTAMVPTDTDKLAVENAMKPILELYSNPDIDTSALNAKLDDIWTAFLGGKIDKTELVKELTDLGNSMETTAGQAALLLPAITSLTDAQVDFAASMDSLRVSGQGSMADTLTGVHTQFADLSQTFADGSTAAGKYADAQKRILDAVKTGNIDVPKFLSVIDNLNMLLDTKQISPETYGKAIVGLSLDMNEFVDQSKNMSTAVSNINDLLHNSVSNAKTAADQIGAFNKELDASKNGGVYDDAATKLVKLSDVWAKLASGDPDAVSGATDLFKQYNLELRNLHALGDVLHSQHLTNMFGDTGVDKASKYLDEAKQRAADLASTLQDAAHAYVDLKKTQTDALNQVVDDLAGMQGVDSFLARVNLTGYSTAQSQVAENINTTTAAMSNMKRVVIDNTDAIGQQVSDLNDWATTLIGVRGTWAEIDDLLANKRISQDQYDAAQKAQQQIAAANDSIKVSIQDIQATAAPVFGDLATKQAAYLESLSGMSAQQQAVALGWMDSTTSAQAYSIIQDAVAANNGELGSSGKAMFENMLQGAVTANPALEAILEDMGLISVGADGKITVDYSQATGAKSDIAKLTESIDVLITTLGGIPPLHIETDPADLGVKAIDQAKEHLKQLKDMAGGTGSALSQALGALANARGGGSTPTTSPTVTTLPGQSEAPPSTVSTNLTTSGDALSQVTALQTALGHIAATTAQPKINVQGDAPVVVPSVSDNLKRVSEIKAMPTINATDDATPTVDHLRLGLEDISAQKTVAQLNAADGATPTVDHLRLGLEDIEAQKTIATINGDDTDAQGKVAGIRALDGATLAVAKISIVAVQAGEGAVGSAKSAAQSAIDAAHGATVTNTTTTTIDVVDNASGPIKNIQTELDALPDTKSIAIALTGAPDAISIAGGVNQAVMAVPSGRSTFYQALGVTDAVFAAASMKLVIEDVPSGRSTFYEALGVADAVIAAGSMKLVIEDVPSGRSTFYEALGVADAVIAAGSMKLVVEDVPSGRSTFYEALGVADAVFAAGSMKLAVEDVPSGRSTFYEALGVADAVLAAGSMKLVIEDVPSGRSTFYEALGVTDAVYAAGSMKLAIEDVPAERDSYVYVYGANDAANAAYSVRDAVNSIPDRTVTITMNTVTTDTPKATGGYVRGTGSGALARMGEQGPELLRFPNGKAGLAQTDAYYAVPSGTYVYTAAETRNMIRTPGDVGAYAVGGYVDPKALGLKGVFNAAAAEFHRQKGAMGGAILNGWEMLTNGYWRNVATGLTQKGIRAEDGSYVNPGFGGGASSKGNAGQAWTGINDALNKIATIKDSDGKTPGDIDDLSKDISALLNGNRDDTRSLIQDLTDAQKKLVDYTIDKKHPAAAITAASALSDAIKKLTTGGTTKLPGGYSQSYGRGDKTYGSMKPNTPQPNTHRRTSTPNNGANNGGVVQNYTVIQALRSDELVKVLSDSEKGKVAWTAQRRSVQASSTSRVRSNGGD